MPNTHWSLDGQELQEVLSPQDLNQVMQTVWEANGAMRTVWEEGVTPGQLIYLKQVRVGRDAQHSGNDEGSCGVTIIAKWKGESGGNTRTPYSDLRQALLEAVGAARMRRTEVLYFKEDLGSVEPIGEPPCELEIKT